MTKEQFSIYVICAAIFTGIGSHFLSQHVVQQLEQATAKQCRTHDWPAAADRIHKDWCIDNGYKI